MNPEKPNLEKRVANQILLAFVKDNITLNPGETRKLKSLLENWPSFYDRLFQIYQMFNSDIQANKEGAGILLEQLKSDIQAMLEAD